jgi:hypothetical protein
MKKNFDIAIDILFLQHKIKSGDLPGFLEDWKINSKKFMIYNAEGKFVVDPELDFIFKYSIGGLLYDALNKFTASSIKKKFNKNVNELLKSINVSEIMEEFDK